MSDVPCENTFDRWSREAPDRLVAYLASDAPQHLLTFAAEIAGNLPAEIVKEPLVALLSHASPCVREGAIYGLARQVDDLDVRARIASLAGSDESAAVRSVAGDTLETYEKGPT